MERNEYRYITNRGHYRTVNYIININLINR
jgi:hypothetical protein